MSNRVGLTHPVIHYVREKYSLPHDAALKEKYLRLRKIFVHFRSHSRGRLAKYKKKIEHERVLRNDLGKAILERCLADGILTLEGSHYFLHPENINKYLGISWADLRAGRMSNELEQYLRSIS